MSIFDKMFGKTNEEVLPKGWNILETPEQLSLLKKESREKPVVIFKHSTHCGVSHMAKHELEKNWDFTTDELSLYLVFVIQNRPVSNEVARDFSVHHQSPQILLLKNERAIYNTSHHQISLQGLREALAR